MTNQLASLEQRDNFYLDPFSSVNLGTYIIKWVNNHTFPVSSPASPDIGVWPLRKICSFPMIPIKLSLSKMNDTELKIKQKVNLSCRIIVIMIFSEGLFIGPINKFKNSCY